MGKSKALETALNNKLLSSHEHLKKGIFSPPLYYMLCACVYIRCWMLWPCICSFWWAWSCLPNVSPILAIVTIRSLLCFGIISNCSRYEWHCSRFLVVVMPVSPIIIRIALAFVHRLINLCSVLRHLGPLRLAFRVQLWKHSFLAPLICTVWTCASKTAL